MRGLTATLADFAAFTQNPVHRRFGAQVDTLV
jgi:hypothetical protein